MICTKNAAVSLGPTSGGSSLNGSGGSLNYGLYVDSAMTKTWGNGSILNMNFTGGSGQFSTSLFVAFKTVKNVAGHLSPSQLQAAFPDFNPNLFYAYYWTSTNTQIYYNYDGQYSSATIPSGDSVLHNEYQAVFSTSPQTLPNNRTGSALYYILPPGTITGTTGTYGANYQVPTIIGNNPIKATATSSAQPIDLVYYAKIPYGQNVSPGIYTDTVVIQINF